MAQGVDEARKQRELTKSALAADLDRLEARVRADLDWRARLRRDGPRIAAVGAAAVIVVGGVLLLRRRFAHRPARHSDPVSIDDLTAELREIRRQLEKNNGRSSSLVQKALLRGVSAAGSAGGTLLARRMLERQGAPEEGAEAARAG